MNKRELPLIIATFSYFIILFLCLLMLFICIPLKVSGVEYLVIIFMSVLLIGYLVIALIRMNTYVYICPHCGTSNKMNFIEALFAKRGNNERKLKCEKCSKKEYMERQLR